MKNLLYTIQDRTTGRLVSFFLLLTLGLYATIMLVTIPYVQGYAPYQTLFDLSPAGYSYEYAVELLSALGPEGRLAYLSVQLPLDFVYPGFLAISYTLLLIWLFGKGFASESIVYYLAFVPVLAGMFDYLENIGIFLMLRSYADLSPTIVSFASVNTLLKSGFTTGFFLLLFVGIIAAARKKFVVWNASKPSAVA